MIVSLVVLSSYSIAIHTHAVGYYITFSARCHVDTSLNANYYTKAQSDLSVNTLYWFYYIRVVLLYKGPTIQLLLNDI